MISCTSLLSTKIFFILFSSTAKVGSFMKILISKLVLLFLCDYRLGISFSESTHDDFHLLNTKFVSFIFWAILLVYQSTLW